YVGGEFTTADGNTVNHIAKWNGNTWSPLTDGTNGVVYALAVFDHGNGPVLYVGGSFSTAGGINAARIARWDGLDWRRVRAGIDGEVRALQVFDDGSGDALFVGGLFTRAGNQEVSNLAKWSGSGWSAVSEGANNWIHVMTVFEDGGGSALYVGGDFWEIGGQQINRIARWDGANWTPLGSGIAYPGEVSACNALGVFDDGTGTALYVGGAFSLAGGVPANHIAKWTGTDWFPLGDGIMSDSGFLPPVTAMTAYDDGAGSSLYLGGDFYAAGPHQSFNIARWGCPVSACEPCDMNCDGSVNALDIEPFLDLLFGPNPQPCGTCTGDVNGDGRIDALDIEPFLECLFG
ncbi:MAG: hypothetical protein IID33_11995, partial [Planctomycetes bacterium]|nr:hypothetical protein [Planctomycetota bacterium]